VEFLSVGVSDPAEDVKTLQNLNEEATYSTKFFFLQTALRLTLVVHA
jgi:hypothetical protein